MCWIRTVVIFFFLWVLVSLTEGFLLRPRSIFATTFKKASFPSSALTPAFRPSSHGPQQYEDFSDKSIVDNERPGVKQEAKMSRRVYVDDTKRGKKHSTTRRKAMDALKSALAGIASSTVIGRFKKENDLRVASAAPPIAIIAEELGYFPVTNRHGKTTYVPARVKRSSTDQAVLLAKYLKSSGAIMYGAFWCPHCQRQKEMFGKEAWSYLNYVECAQGGEGSKPKVCNRAGINGFPTWKFKNGEDSSGEMPLVQLARISGYAGSFDGSVEPELPIQKGSCR